MKQRIFGWISILIGVGLGLALVEVTAIAWLYLEDGHYTPAAELFERTQNTYVRDATKGTACRYVDTLYPHPYVGFVHHANPPCGQALGQQCRAVRSGFSRHQAIRTTTPSC